MKIGSCGSPDREQGEAASTTRRPNSSGELQTFHRNVAKDQSVHAHYSYICTITAGSLCLTYISSKNFTYVYQSECVLLPHRASQRRTPQSADSQRTATNGASTSRTIISIEQIMSPSAHVNGNDTQCCYHQKGV